MDKSAVIKKYNLSRKQIDLIDNYILKLKKCNQVHNLVGPSTIDVAWDRHINDSLQLSEFILKKNASEIKLCPNFFNKGHFQGFLSFIPFCNHISKKFSSSSK